MNKFIIFEKKKQLSDTKMNLDDFIEKCSNNTAIPDHDDEVSFFR
jgi:hypothetical protein